MDIKCDLASNNNEHKKLNRPNFFWAVNFARDFL
jgi:hypothetical protein